MEEFYEDEIKNKEAEAKAASEALRIGIVAAVLIVATISLLAVIL